MTVSEFLEVINRHSGNNVVGDVQLILDGKEVEFTLETEEEWCCDYCKENGGKLTYNINIVKTQQ